jgi:hypothetical protein
MANWCGATDVQIRLAAVGGSNFDTNEIAAYIVRAQDEIKSRLLAVYPVTTITGWNTTVPARIKMLTADLAALLLLKDKMADFTGRTGDSKATYGFMDDLIEGTAEIFDANSNPIARTSHKVSFSTSSKTPIFSMGNEGDDTLGDGSLDSY